MNIYLIFAASVLLLLSVLISKISDRFGVPALLFFLLLGMLAGSDGLGGIHFDDPSLAQTIGILSLILILFSGGLDTRLHEIRPILKEGILLSTLGIFGTALIMGLIACYILQIPLLEGFLFGAIVSSTDAAAVFTVLRSKGIRLKGHLKPLLELESGSNDPMAIFLTVGLIQWINQPTLHPAAIILMFFQQMVFGAIIGLIMGKGMLILVNRLKLSHDGLYPVLTLSLVLITFSIADMIGGNGFLAVYLTGILMGQQEFLHRSSLSRFHDGLSWIMQITMFLTLGLLVFPSKLVPVIGTGFLFAIALIFIARPVSVFLCLWPLKYHWREKMFISWVGLRGAAPIILATYPLLAGIKQADLIFNIVFFVVLTSILLQGTSLSLVARWLKLDLPFIAPKKYPIEYVHMEGLKSELKEIPIPQHSEIIGKAIFELGLPDDFLVVLIARHDEFIVPSGGTLLEPNDVLLVLSENKSLNDIITRYALSA
jgi:cell volume regulation protein A